MDLAASVGTSVDWNQGMGFSPVRFDVGEWTRGLMTETGKGDGDGGEDDTF